MKAPVVLLSLLLTGACARAGPASHAAEVPEGWTVIAAPLPESEAATCANRAVDEWTVGLDADSVRPVIHRLRDERYADTATVPGGRLTAENHGEFGGAIWWEPAKGRRTRVAATNLVAFVPARAGLLGLTGLAHLSLNEGQLVRFLRRPDGGWSMEQVLDLGAAPYAYVALSDDTLLVVGSGVMTAVHPPSSVRVLHRNAVWRYTYPNSVVRDKLGVVYVGMRSAVARLTPSVGGYVEDWLVPSNCAKRRHVTDIGECECSALQH